MTDHHDAHDARAVLRRLPIPDHRNTFWEELERRLDSLPAGLPTTTDPSDLSDLSDRRTPAPGAVIELTRPPDRPRRAWPRPAAAAAALVIVGLTAAGIAVLTRDDGEGVQVATPASATTAAPGTEATVTTAPPTTGATSAPGGTAEGAALEWIDLLASGDMAGAWERLGPAAQAGWGSYEAFEEARTAFSEGFGTWATAEDRRVGVATVRRPDGGALHVVTLTGVRYPEANREDGALAFAVREDADGNYLVEPPSPAGAVTVQFTVPTPSATPPTIGAGEAAVVATSGPATALYLFVDGESEPVTPALGSDGTASHVPPEGWPPGRHVVTALVDGDAGPAATAVVFEVA